MSADDDQGLPLADVLRSVAQAEVVTFYFPAFRKTLIFDARTDELEGPMITVVDMVTSTEERFRGLKRLRPRFGRPETLVLVPWPRSVESLARLGIMQEMIDRCRRLGSDAGVAQCRTAYRELVAIERAEKVAVIRGEGYQTIWSRE